MPPSLLPSREVMLIAVLRAGRTLSGLIFVWAIAALFTALTASAGLAQALTPKPSAGSGAPASDPWERVGLFEGRTLYIDPTTARRSGSRIQVFVITDLREPNATARGRQYWSKKSLLEFDCHMRTLKILQDVWHTRKMGQGEPVWQTEGPASAALPVPSDSAAEMLWKAACGRR